MEQSRISRWLRRTIQVVGALVLMDATSLATDLLKAHTCGLNRFELTDSLLFVTMCAKLAAGVGTMLLKRWGRMLMLVCLLTKAAYIIFNFALVLRISITDVDALGWFLMLLILGIFAGLILLFWLGWNRVFQMQAVVTSRKWAIIGTVCVGVGIAVSLLEDIGTHEEVATQADLDARFLLAANAWPIHRATTRGAATSRSAGQLLVRELDGRILIRNFPPGSRCEAIFDPATGKLAIQGVQFKGEVYEATPLMVGRKKLRGLSFKREEGAIRGDIALGLDEEGNLFVFVAPLTVYGKRYEAIYVSPRREALGQSGIN